MLRIYLNHTFRVFNDKLWTYINIFLLLITVIYFNHKLTNYVLIIALFYQKKIIFQQLSNRKIIYLFISACPLQIIYILNNFSILLFNLIIIISLCFFDIEIILFVKYFNTLLLLLICGNYFSNKYAVNHSELFNTFKIGLCYLLVLSLLQLLFYFSSKIIITITTLIFFCLLIYSVFKQNIVIQKYLLINKFFHDRN
jgi:hypothetical protein